MYKVLTRAGLQMTGESLTTLLVEVPLDFKGNLAPEGEQCYVIVNSCQDIVYLTAKEVEDKDV